MVSSLGTHTGRKGRIFLRPFDLSGLILVTEFGFRRLYLAAVEPAADAQERFLRGNRSGCDRLQGCHQNIPASRKVQPAVHGPQVVTGLLDLVHQLP
jgi:hypothetical protein